ncbi:MAG: hypothetical protein ACTSPI_13955 [Candidatus Heimdallarchaeaceae archaeon]
MNESLPSLSITMKMYGWSKWGGGRMGITKETLDEWYCQICGEKQLKGFPSYMIPIGNSGREYARVCTKCKAKAVEKHINSYFKLMSIIKDI